MVVILKKCFIIAVLLAVFMMVNACTQGRKIGNTANNEGNNNYNVEQENSGFGDIGNEQFKYVYSENIVYRSDSTSYINNVKKCSNNELIAILYASDYEIEFARYDQDFNKLGSIGNDIKKEERIDAYSIDDDMNIYIIKYNRSYKGAPASPEGRIISVYDYDGKHAKDIQIDDAKIINGESAVKKFIIRNNQIYLISFSGIQITDMNGRTLCEIENELVDADISNDGNIILIKWDNKFCYREKFDSKAGENIWSIKMEESTDKPNIIWCDEKEESFYTLSNNYIYKYNKVGEFIDRIINFYLYNIGIEMAENRRITDLVNSGTCFYIIIPAINNSFKEIIRFDLLSGNDAEKRKQELEQEYRSRIAIKVLMPLKDVVFDKKAMRFQEENKINIDISYYSDNFDNLLTGNGLEDYTQYINLQIMSGMQWDILSISMLPHSNYTQRGVFANLNSLDRGNELNNGNIYYTNIIDACRENGGLFIFPVGYTIDILTVSKQYLKENAIKENAKWTWSGLIESSSKILTSNSTIKPFTFLSKKSIDSTLNMLIVHQLSNTYTNKNKISFKNKLFYSYLDTIKSLSSEKIFCNNPAEISIFDIKLLHAAEISNISKDVIVAPLPMLEGSDAKALRLQEGYAINEKSNNKATAFEFIKYLSENTSYFPVSKSAYKALTDKYSQTENKATLNVISGMIESLNVCFRNDIFDVNVSNFLNKVKNKYCEGIITKEQAAAELEEKLWLYFNE